MAKNENHPRVSFDGLNEVFWCTDYNAKNHSSLQSQIFEKIKKNLKKIAFLKKKWYFFVVFTIFFRNGTLQRAEGF